MQQVGDWTHAVGERVGAGPATAAAMTKAVMAGYEKDETGSDFILEKRGDFVEIGNAMSNRLPAVRIDGPYGAPAEDVFDSEAVVLVGAGIGVTPLASILKRPSFPPSRKVEFTYSPIDIWYRQCKAIVGALKRVEFFWIVCAQSFGWFHSLLKRLKPIVSTIPFSLVA